MVDDIRHHLLEHQLGIEPRRTRQPVRIQRLAQALEGLLEACVRTGEAEFDPARA